MSSCSGSAVFISKLAIVQILPKSAKNINFMNISVQSLQFAIFERKQTMPNVDFIKKSFWKVQILQIKDLVKISVKPHGK